MGYRDYRYFDIFNNTVNDWNNYLKEIYVVSMRKNENKRNCRNIYIIIWNILS